MEKPKIITVTLNPCMDKTVEVARFRTGKTNRVLESRMDIGGKGINVSRALLGSGVPFVATGLTAGAYGRKLVDCLENMGVLCAFCEAQGETRVNLKILDADTGEMTELNERGFSAAGAYADFVEALLLFLPDAEVLTLSGSLPPDLGVGVYRELTSLANSLGVRVILDADGSALQSAIESKPYAIKPNLEEFQRLIGEPVQTVDDIVAAARRTNEQGVELVAVSCGAQGAVFVRDSLAVQTKPFPIEVGSAAAAGDSMVAMLAWATVHSLTLVETAKLMTAAGTCTASLPGTQVAPFAEAFARAQDVQAIILET